MAPDDQLASRIRRTLARAGDPERAAQQAAYMKSSLPFHGVAKTALPALLRPLLTPWPFPNRDAWEAAVRDVWDGATHREERYAALHIAGHRHARLWQDIDTLSLHRDLIVGGAWWDFVDEIATRLVGPILLAHPDAATPVVDGWAIADDRWLRRAAILAQLKHRTATNTDLLRRCIVANLEPTPFGGEFFIRKAIGWALREHAKTDAGWVRAFVVEFEDALSPLSRREAMKHLRT
ncbi:MAG: DNA alkylation repair protein [Propionibacterium sp.]|nr:DNA alkylation repair protein [Propionibacterium sp.]